MRRVSRKTDARRAVALCVLLAAGMAGAQTWDVAPPNEGGAIPPEICPKGNGVSDSADALVTLRRALDLVSGFSCFGVPISDSIVDVAPASVDASTDPPTVVSGGDGVVNAADALLILRAAVRLINLVPASDGPDLLFVGAVSSPPFVEASDADRSPTGNFPGPEDLDDGNGVIDQRRVALFANVRATPPVPATALCAFDFDPRVFPSAIPIECQQVAAFTQEENRALALDIPSPARTGTVPIWVALDSDGEVDEANETDNVTRVDLSVVAPLPSHPDLSFDPVRPFEILPRTPAVGDSLTVTAFIRNQGTADAIDPFALDLWLDLAAPPMEGECGLFVGVEGGLAAGAERSVVKTGVSLGSTAAGAHDLWGYVDSGFDQCPPPENGDILESREGNNATLVPLRFCVSSSDQVPGGSIDLSADALDINIAGPVFSVAATFSNSGLKDVVPFVGSTSFPPAEIQIRIEVPGGSPAVLATDRDCIIHGTSERLQFNQSFAIPALLPTTVRLLLDPSGNVVESNEENNQLCVRVNPSGVTESCS